MFKFLKFGKHKTGPPRNTDFDVLSSVTVENVTISRDEIVNLLLFWTQGEKKMSMTDLGQKIRMHCKGFQKKYVVEGVVLHNTYGEMFAGHVINAYRRARLVSEESPDVYKLTKRGEQVRQFYVLLNGWRGTIYDRMNEFKNMG